MTTSSDHRAPTPEPNHEHWAELIATLPDQSTDEFGTWLSDELSAMESELEAFVTRNSLRKDLRR